MDYIVALYWDNIDRRVVEAQRAVFAHFQLLVDQRERTGVNHGDFLDAYMAEIGEEDVALLTDVDCFPLNRDIVDKAFAAAREGRIFGCAQATNHIDPDRLYVAPMFMAISRKTWDRLGRPSFKPDVENDVAQRLNDVARAAGVGIDMLMPWGAIVQNGGSAMSGSMAWAHSIAAAYFISSIAPHTLRFPAARGRRRGAARPAC